MHNFVSLTCPSCNASISINAKDKTAKCEYCGREFVCQNELNKPQYENHQQYQNEKQLQGDDW